MHCYSLRYAVEHSLELSQRFLLFYVCHLLDFILELTKALGGSPIEVQYEVHQFVSLAATCVVKMALPKPSKGYPMTAIAYIGQHEKTYLTSIKMVFCSQCGTNGFQKSLKRCNGCRLVDYCSTE